MLPSDQLPVWDVKPAPASLHLMAMLVRITRLSEGSQGMRSRICLLGFSIRDRKLASQCDA